MPKWISVEKAVIKYHIEKEAILLWVEMGQFPMLYIDNVPNVDEECILELFRRTESLSPNPSPTGRGIRIVSLY